MLNTCFWCYSQVVQIPLHVDVEEGWKQGFPSWSIVGARFQREGFVQAREVSPHFFQGVDVYVLCVCVYVHTACGVLGCEPRC